MIRGIIVTYLCLLGLFFQPISLWAQVTAGSEVTLKEILQQIETKKGIHFLYVEADINATRTTSFQYNDNRTIAGNLALLLDPLRLKAVSISATQYVITKQQTLPSDTGKILLEGQVVTITDHLPLANAFVFINTAQDPVITGADGRFNVMGGQGDTLSVQLTGYNKLIYPVAETGKPVLLLTPAIQPMADIVVVGSHTAVQRSKTETPVPVDILKIRELQQTGRTGFAQMLQYTSPSFNTGQYGINNIASIVDPATLRGLGPDQMLVLINGKRQHNTSGLNLNNTIGKGTAGTDLDAFPSTMIAGVEILRDGAAAQYGSDAIAGVLNIRLKQDTGGHFYTLAGITEHGDGGTLQTALNYGIRAGHRGGFIHFTLNYEYRDATDRGAAYTGLVYRKAIDTSGLNNGQFPTATSKIKENTRLDDSVVAAKHFDRNVGVYGSSGLKSYAVWINSEVPLGKDWVAYSFGGISRRSEYAYGFYRFPNDDRNASPLFPEGYLPEFPTRVNDASLCVGVRHKSKSGWHMDISTAYGSNQIIARAANTVNASMGAASPTDFELGGTTFRQSTTDLNLSRNFKETGWVQSLSIALGATARLDQYIIHAGEYASYADGNDTTLPVHLRKLAATNGRPGFTPANTINATRFNLGTYAEAEAFISERLLLAGALRYEHYSDFGSNISGKLSARLKLAKGMALRAAVNRGFRAPSLQQIYYSQEQSQIFSKNGQAGLYRVQHFRNDDPLIRQLGVQSLQPETSWNLAAGFTATSGNKWFFTADVYRIQIHNRIVVSARLDSTVAVIKPLLAGTQNTDIQFFTNAISTTTQGLDVVLTYRNRLPGQSGVLSLNAALALNATMIDAGVRGIKTPGGNELPAEKLLTRTDIGIIEDAQPKSKIILSVVWQWRRWEAMLRNTRFGNVIYRDINPALDQTYRAKIITDLSANYRIYKTMHLMLGINNLLDVYPDRVTEVPALNTNLTSSGQVPYSRVSTPFGFNGRSYFGMLQFDF